MGGNGDIKFLNNITPLNQTNLQKVVDNLDYLYNTIQDLTPIDEESGVKPLPVTSGDGIIRYVVTVKYDMLGLSDPVDKQPPIDKGDGRYFVAVLDDDPNHRYHLEIGCRENGIWKSSTNGQKTIRTDNGLEIKYTQYAGDRCTHDKLYICQNTNRCYYMIDKYGVGTPITIAAGTTNQSSSFMVETAQACDVISTGVFNGADGIARSKMLRYKMVVMNFRLKNARISETKYKNEDVVLSVAFDPGGVVNVCKTMFVPITVPYFSSETAEAPSSVSAGVIKIYDDQETFKFYAYVGTNSKTVLVDALVGATDMLIGGNVVTPELGQHTLKCRHFGAGSSIVTLTVVSTQSVPSANLNEVDTLIQNSLNLGLSCYYQDKAIAGSSYRIVESEESVLLSLDDSSNETLVAFINDTVTSANL